MSGKNIARSASGRRLVASLFACALATAAGSSACLGGDIKVAVPKSTARILAIGPIENRDARYSPFTTQNFVDMLDFELVRLGYDTLRARDLDAAAQSESDSGKPEKKKSRKETQKKSQKESGQKTQDPSKEKSERPEPQTGEEPDGDSGATDPAATIEESDARPQPADDAAPANDAGESQAAPGDDSEGPAPDTGEAGPADESEAAPATEGEAQPGPANEAEPAGESEAEPTSPEEEPAAEEDGPPIVWKRLFPAGGGPRSGLLEYLAQADNKKKASDAVSDLLPDYLQDVAGQNPPPEVIAGSTNAKRRRQYSKQEIAEFFKEHPADFFLQGSIGRTESGDLLDSEQNTLIFLEIYGRTGERIGVVSYLIRGETLAAPNILRDVCEEVVETISGQVLK